MPQNKASGVLVVTQSQAHQGHRDAGSGVLAFDPALLRAIAERVGTPVYVYSANLIRAQYHALHDALKDVPHRICYSVKANGNIGVLRVLKAAGAGADIVSVGELRRALAAGFDAASIVFSGVGKTALELEEAIRVGVGFLNIESPAELDAVIAAAHKLKKRANLGIRVNPDVATETHPYTKTGEKTAKFGVPYDEVVSVAQRIAAEPLFTLRGLAMHLGSQITDVEPYHRGTVKLLELVTALRVSGMTTVEALDVGGGLGVRYHNEKAPSPQAFAEAVAPPIKQAGLALICEPGRYLVANAGVLVTRVLYRKHAGGKEFVVVDAGMTDFVRPSHYNAHHEIVPLQDGARGEELVNIVGPICESGDFLALDRKLPTVEPGAYLAVLGTGAYGFVMSSTYNQRPRPPEVLVDGNRYYVARQRETLEDLLRGEILEPTTWYQA
jgi:diaminopimelate decarboxylase